MKKLISLVFVLGIMSVFCITGCSDDKAPANNAKQSGETEDLATALANMKPMNLKMPISLADSHALTAGFRDWCNEVERVTDGKIKITIYPSGSLIKSGSIYIGVRDGVAEVGEEDVAYNPNEFPLFSAFFLGGFSFPNTVAASVAANEWIKADFKEYTYVKMLWAYSMPPSVLMGNKKIEKLEDLKGTQVRVTGFCKDTIERLGGTPVGITMPETYDALLKGTVDVNLSNPGVLGKPNNLSEVSKYVTICPGISYIPHPIFMNLNIWNSIPTVVQAEIEKLSLPASINTGKIAEKYYNDGLKAARDKDIPINEISPEEMNRWYNILEAQHSDWIKEKAARGNSQTANDLLFELVTKYADYTD